MAESMADGHGGRLSAEALAKLAEGKFAASVKELSAEGMTKADLEKAFKAALVADGSAHMYPSSFAGMHAWDVAAGHALCRATGADLEALDG